MGNNKVLWINCFIHLGINWRTMVIKKGQAFGYRTSRGQQIIEIIEVVGDVVFFKSSLHGTENKDWMETLELQKILEKSFSEIIEAEVIVEEEE